MGDYGKRISIAGQDVKTCSDLDCVVTSKYANLKGAVSGSGSVDFTDTTSAETITVTVAHGLGYIPTARVSVDATEAVGAGEYVELPSALGYADRFYNYFYKADATNVTITLRRQNDAGGALNVDYKYFIYLDKGKLN